VAQFDRPVLTSTCEQSVSNDHPHAKTISSAAEGSR